MTRVQQSHAFRGIALVALPLTLIAALSGCSGSGGKTASVSGKVTYKNAPVTGGQIMFHTSSGAPIMGAINPDGTFSFGGVPIGPATVTIDTDSLKGQAGGSDYTKMGGKHEGFKAPEKTGGNPVYVKIPPKYKDPKTSKLSVDVKKGKNEDMNFDLTD
jgi:hypothetical protein